MNIPKQQRVLIIGAGCIGLYIGLKLKHNGHHVTLLGRRKLAQIAKTILIGNIPYVVPQKIFHAPQKQHFDLIFITTKLYHLFDSLRLLQKNNITADHLFSIQNGLVDEQTYQNLLSGKALTIISVFEGIQIQGNELIVSSTGLGWKTENTADGQLASQLLTAAGISCTAESTLLKIRAEKTIVNCCLNVLSAIEQKQFYELFEDRRLVSRIKSIFKECYSVLEIATPLDPPEEIWDRLQQAWSHTHHFSSTYQDLISGRETEIEFLTGYILQLAKKQAIPTPENEKIYAEFISALREYQSKK